jgi:molybdate transport system substrate-binding protein
VVLKSRWILAAAFLFACGPPRAAEIRVAVASNFAETIREITRRFEAETGHQVVLTFGSTGKHFAQIVNGAPFDVFLAADARRPQLLEKEGVAVPGSRFTYAVGRIVLWSPTPGYVDPEGEVLETGDFRHLALANPKLAPYGRAARQVLEANGLWRDLEGRAVRGENIGQTYQFIGSGNAELGFVAWSQVLRSGAPPAGSWWEVPRDLYTPIEQQAVLLIEDAGARAFLDFIRSEAAVEIIRTHGYDSP